MGTVVEKGSSKNPAKVSVGARPPTVVHDGLKIDYERFKVHT